MRRWPISTLVGFARCRVICAIAIARAAEYGVYKYPHDYPEGWVDQRYLPEGLERGAFWRPAGRGWEEWRVEQSERDRSGNAPK